MFRNSYGYTPRIIQGTQVAPYYSAASYYDTYDSIPLPYISCSCDPEYEMLWCASQNVSSPLFL